MRQRTAETAHRVEGGRRIGQRPEIAGVDVDVLVESPVGKLLACDLELPAADVRERDRVPAFGKPHGVSPRRPADVENVAGLWEMVLQVGERVLELEAGLRAGVQSLPFFLAELVIESRRTDRWNVFPVAFLGHADLPSGHVADGERSICGLRRVPSTFFWGEG